MGIPNGSLVVSTPVAYLPVIGVTISWDTEFGNSNVHVEQDGNLVAGSNLVRTNNFPVTITHLGTTTFNLFVDNTNDDENGFPMRAVITVKPASTRPNKMISINQQATAGNLELEKVLRTLTDRGITGPSIDKKTQVPLVATATLTIAQLLSKVLDGTPIAAATYTLPTATLLVAGMPDCTVGDGFSFFVNNKSAGANTITIAAGSGGTADGTLTVAQDVIRQFVVIVTNVDIGAQAYFVYGVA